MAISLGVVSDSMGSGKTSVLGETSDLLTANGIVHAAIDLDAMLLRDALIATRQPYLNGEGTRRRGLGRATGNDNHEIRPLTIGNMAPIKFIWCVVSYW